MKAYLLIVFMLASQGSILFTQDLKVSDYLFEYTIVQNDVPENLSSYDVLVISTPSALYTEEEVQAIETFVESGGGLVLLAEENNKEGTTLVLNQLAQVFSITFNADKIYDTRKYTDPTWVDLTTFPSHPVFQGISSVVYTAGCSLEVGEGAVVVRASKDAYSQKYDGLTTHQKGDFPVCMAFIERGKGRIFACGDKELLDNYLHFRDNTLFGMNLFDWMTGNESHIQERLTYKSDALTVISEAEARVQTAVDNGLKEVYPQVITKAENLIAEAKTLHTQYRYHESYQKALEAQQTVEEGEKAAEARVDAKKREVEECLSSIEKSAVEYLPSQLEAARYYVQESDQQKTYAQKEERLDAALTLCHEIGTQLKTAAEAEINTAREKLSAYTGVFGRANHNAAQDYLTSAQESYDKGEYSDAIEYAKKSQAYADQATQEGKKDYFLYIGIVLIVVLILYVVVRK